MRPATGHGGHGHGHARQTAPSGYTIAAVPAAVNATTATAAGFTFAGAELGTTYNYTVTSSGGGTAVTGSGSVTSATQDVTGINVSSLPDGTLTFSVTLDRRGRQRGTAATATATLDTDGPQRLHDHGQPGHGQRQHGRRRRALPSPPPTVGDDLQLHGHQQRRRGLGHRQRQRDLGHAGRHRHQRLLAARRHADLQRHVDRRGRQYGHCGHGHGHARPTVPSGYTITADLARINARPGRGRASPLPTP